MSSSAIRARILADSHHSRRDPIIHGTAATADVAHHRSGGYGSVAEAEMNEGDQRLDPHLPHHQTQHHGGNDRLLQTNSSTLSSNYDDGNTHHEHRNGDDDYDDDDSATNDSSDASSLDEDDVREVVKQVMMMVKHNRRSTSTAASQSNGRTQSSIDSTQNPPTGGGTATRLSSLETTARTSVSLSLSQQSQTQLLPSQHNPKLAAALAALANGSPTISVPASSRFSRNGGGAKELKSANVSTYASRVGITTTTTTTTTINSAAVAAASGVSGTTLSPRSANNTFGERQPDAIVVAVGEERPSSAIRFSRRPTDEEDDIHMRGRPSARATPGKPRMLFGGQQPLSPNHLSRQFLVSPAKAPHDDGGTIRGRRAAAPQLSRSASDSSRLQRAANHHHPITPAQQRVAANDPCDTSTISNMTYVEQRRIERMIMQRNEALREETFTPRTSLQRDGVVSEVPENIRNIPTRGPGHWEDRLYNEYLSRKKHKELENEALRIAKEAHKELTDALDECSFTPDLAAIHDHMRHWKKDSPAFTQGGGATAAGGTATGCVNSRSSSAVGLSKRDRAAMVTERLYKPPLLTAATLQGDSVLTGQPPPPIHPEDMKPSETQQRLYEEHKKRQQEKQRLLDAKLKELNISSFVFQIKGNYYETLPFPQHADPGSFERLYKEGQKRQAKRTQQQEEALARRPSPVPEISEYARRRGRSAQPAFERLSVVKKNNVASANNNNGDNAGGGIVNPNARSSSPPLCSSPTPQDATVRNLMSSRPRALSIADPFSSIPMLNISQVYGGGGGGGGVDGSSHNATPLQRSFTAAGFNNGGVGAASEHILNWVNNTTTTTTNLHHQQHQASSQYGTHLSALHPLSHHHNNSTTASAVVSAAVSRQESLNHNYQFHHHNNNQLSAGHPHHNIVPGATGLQRSSFLTGARSPVMLTVLSPCAPGESGGFPQQQDAQQLSGAENRSDGVLTAVGAAPPMRLQPVGGAQLQPVATPPPALVSALIDEDASGNYILTARTSYYSAVNDGPSPMDSAPDSLDKTTRPPPALVPKDDAPAGRMPNTTMSVAHHQQPQRQSSSPSSSSRQLKERAAGSPGGMSPSVMLFEKYVEVSSESGSSAAPSTPRRRRSQGFGGGRRRSSAIVLAVDEPESAVEEVVEEDDLAFVLAN